MAKRGEEMQAKLLTLLRQRNQPQSAYALLGQMQLDNPRLAPPTVYRALAALTERGAVHRLESKRAFVACQRGDHADGCIMAICDDCGAVEEHVAPGLIHDLSIETAKSGFVPTRHMIEVRGHCAACGSAGAQE